MLSTHCGRDPGFYRPRGVPPVASLEAARERAAGASPLRHGQDTHREATATSVVEFLVFDTANPNSIVAAVSQARENARTVRDDAELFAQQAQQQQQAGRARQP
jgi:A predicted alpha-helical domain with a conserved ER motif.